MNSHSKHSYHPPHVRDEETKGILIPELVPFSTFQTSLTMKAGPKVHTTINKQENRTMMGEGLWANPGGRPKRRAL